MVRIILGVIIGFTVWSILWIGSDQVLINLFRDWYGAHQFEMERAYYNQTPFTADSTILAISIVRSIIFSIMSGFLAAVVSGENQRAPLLLGILLLVFGLLVQISMWSLAPVWYHVIFLVLLVPMAVAGGRFKSRD
ncbi:MAG TPA: hypothetical protein PKD26_07730 [Pyrinomonadaceae bacterium]|nr:hypothetical protein [Pyrinomonadaceae bacterium]